MKEYVQRPTDIFCVRHKHTGTPIYINQNYIPAILYDDFYKWSRCMIFMHHDMDDPPTCTNLIKRANRMIHTLKNYDTNLCIYMSETIDQGTIRENIDGYRKLLDEFKIKSHFLIILCMSNMGNTKLHVEEYDKATFYCVAIDKIENQKTGTDNDIVEYKDEIANPLAEFIKLHYIMDLKDSPYETDDFIRMV